MLKLADTLSLPLDAATQTFAFIARKGAGKTYAAGKLVELLLDAKVQVIVLDTVGNWFGLRLDADGKRSGYDVPVLGGLRGDIPLEAHGGALIADIVVETGRSLVIDVSQFSLGDRKRFATAFGERLWLRKKGDAHPAPLHLVIEESQLIVPQFIGRGGDDARMLGVFEEIIRLGRNYGIGVSMITQRPQSVNKEVLNQTECLLVGQVNGSQERDALKKWITYQGMDVHLVDELPSLKIGTFYVWSPQWLTILKRVQILKKRTFDASATPKVGDKRIQRDLKPLDLNDLQQRLRATIEKARADDPKVLRAKIAELERQIKAAPKGEIQRIEVPVLSDGQIAALKTSVESLRDQATRLLGFGGELAKVLDNEFLPALARAGQRPPDKSPANRPASARSPRVLMPVRHQEPSGDGVGGGGLRRILIALAQRPQGLSAKQLGVRAGLSSSSGTFSNYLGRARTSGWVAGSRARLEITVDGVKALGPYDPLPEGRALLDYWLGELGQSGAARMLYALAQAYPRGLTKDALGEAATISPTSGTFTTYLGRLRALELIEGKGEIRMSEELASL